MKDFNVLFSDTAAPQLPNGVCLGSVGEHNAVQLVIALPESMLTGITFYTITVGGIESAQIVSGSQNVDGAYLLDGVIYQPLTAAYTTQRITDMTVTAYARENGETVVVDKTPTVYGLMFIEGNSAPVPGGIVSEVAELSENVSDLKNDVSDLSGEVEAIRDDIPTAEEVAAWNEAAADKHTHANKATLDEITPTSVSHWNAAYTDKHTHTNKQILERFSDSLTYGAMYRGVPIGVPVLAQLPDTSETDIPDLCACNGNLYQLENEGYVQITSGITPAQATSLIQDKHTHANKTTLDKFGESAGKPTFDGNPIGGGINMYATPSALPNNAENGSVAVALADDPLNTIVYPSQTAGEEVSVDIASKSIMFGNPTFNETAIDAAISAQDISAEGSVSIVTGASSKGDITFAITPVVSDEDTNEYTAAGITIEDALVVPSFTKKYAIQAMFSGTGMVKPDKIVPVDAEHVKVPGFGMYTFENLSGVEMPTGTADMVAGWNMVLVTIDTATYSQITDIEVVSGANPNDYLNLTNHDENTFTIEGVGGSAIFTDTIVGEAGKEKGLYVRLSGAWMRCTLDDDA